MVRGVGTAGRSLAMQRQGRGLSDVAGLCGSSKPQRWKESHGTNSRISPCERVQFLGDGSMGVDAFLKP